ARPRRAPRRAHHQPANEARSRKLHRRPPRGRSAARVGPRASRALDGRARGRNGPREQSERPLGDGVVKAPEIDVGRTGKSVKTFFGWLFFRRISLPLSLRLARTRVRPSWITAFGLGTGITGAVLIAMGDRKLMVVGAVLAMVAKLLDAMDG